MKKPKFVTFTGVDTFTNLADCIALSNLYPIEWGFLYSETNNDVKYSGWRLIHTTLAENLNCAIHLCGTAAQRALTTRSFKYYPKCVKRVQINARSELYNTDALYQLAKRRTIIIQSRDENKFNHLTNNINILYDCSGGKGIQPSKWPSDHSDKLVGYAGGINTDNVKEILGQIDANDFWIDIESGVRTANLFDIEKCNLVCKKIWR